MRYATIEYRPKSGGLHPVDTALSEASSVQRDTINNLSVKRDGTGIVLYRMRGPVETIGEILEAEPTVVSWDVIETADDLRVYVRAEPNETIPGLVRMMGSHELLLDLPALCLDRGGVEATIIGDDAAFERALEDVPDDIYLELVETGDYLPRNERIVSKLTERQREILEVAVEQGYYEEPRNVTYGDIADTLGITTATVGEHLRKIEGKLIREILEV